MRYSEAAIFSGHASLLSQTLMALCAFALIPSVMAMAWIAYAQQHGFLLQADFPMSVIAVAGICAAYCLDRLLDPDPRLQQLYALGLRWLLGFICVVAALCALFVWFQSGWNNILWLTLCVTWASGHVFGKSIPGAKTICVTLAWVTACFALPLTQSHLFLDVSHALHLGLWLILFALSCVLCDFKDEERDRRAGVRSVIVMLGAESSRRFLYLSLSITAVCAGLLQLWALLLLSLLLLLLLPWQQLLRDPILAPIAVDSCLVLSAVCGVFVVY